METFTFDAYMAYGDTEKTRFEIETDDLDAAKCWQEDIVRAIADKPVFCNDLTGQLWMFDEKLSELSDHYWLENIHPSNDLTTVHACLYFEK